VESKKLSRRDFLRLSTLTAAGAALAACGPAPTPEVVKEEVIVRETVVVEGESVEVEVEVEKVVTATPPPAEPVSIVYYDRTSDAPRWADAYNESHDDFTVEVEIQPPDTRYEQLIAAIMAGNAPDVIGLDCVQVGRFAQLSALVPLDDLLSADIKERYFQNLIETERHYGVFEGHLVGVPFWVDNSVCFYNKAMLEEVGGDPEAGIRSWDDHVVYGKACVEELEVFGFATGTVNEFLFGPWVWAQGGDFTDEEWTKSRCDEPPVRNMYQFARDIMNLHKITNDAPATDWGTMMQIFNSGQAMSQYMGGGQVGMIRSEFPDLWEVLGVSPIPGPEEGQISSFIGGNVASISTQTEHLNESVAFLTWATAEDDGMAVTGDVGFLPGCPSGLELDVYQKNWHIYEAFKEALEFGYPSGNDPRFDEVSLTPLNLAWEQSLLGEIPMDEIIETLHTTINGVLQR